ncbi:MAG: PadR family transcriptional regulator [Candidatus Paceibacterota bacterium]|jgi:PadR family transcriptional regulator PadR
MSEKSQGTKITEPESAKADMRRGMLEFVVLLIISRGRIYASDILKELKFADLLVVEGTLYPLLSRLRAEKLLDYTWEESKSGPPRKYYTLTATGKEDLAQLKTTWKSLVKSVETLLK